MIDPDKKAAAAEPEEDGLGGRLFLLGSISLQLPFSLGNDLAVEAKALAKGCSLLLAGTGGLLVGQRSRR